MNNREALFEPGDPIDLARKVLRLLGEPLLRDRIAQNAYERVRRDFTASAARRALRTSYNALTERFAVPFLDPSADDAPKIELLSDDDFEATVFEEARPPVDTALNKLTRSTRCLAGRATRTTSSESMIAPPSPDETMGGRQCRPRGASPAGGVGAGRPRCRPATTTGGDQRPCRGAHTRSRGRRDDGT